MSRNVLGADDEEDIWEYRSQTKKFKFTQHSQCKSLKLEEERKPKPDSKRRPRVSSRKKSNVEVDSSHLIFNSWIENETKENMEDINLHNVKKESALNESCKEKEDPGKKQRKRQRKTEKPGACTSQTTPNHKIWSGRCRICQFPFMALSKVDTPTWHEEICLDVPSSSKQQCPSGILCSSTIESHYKKFRHTALSRSEHKNNNGRKQVSSTGDIQSAKMKLEFDDTDTEMLKMLSPTDDCVIDVDGFDNPDHPDNTNSTGSTYNLSHGRDVAALKRKSDQLKKASVLTLLKQNQKKENDLMKESLIQMDVSGQSLVSSKSNISNNLEFQNVMKPMSLSKSWSEMIEGYKSLQENNPYQKEKRHSSGEEQDSKEVLTKVDMIDLVYSGSSDNVESIQDIDNIADNSRSVTEMLNDVFCEEGSDREENPEVCDEDLLGTFTGILQHESSSDDDTDILQTTLLSNRKYEINKSSTKRCFDYMSKGDHTSDQFQPKPGLSETRIIGKGTSSPRVKDTLADQDSTSKDSSKGFFARKLEEKKCKRSGDLDQQDNLNGNVTSKTADGIKEGIPRNHDDLKNKLNISVNTLNAVEGLSLCHRTPPLKKPDLSTRRSIENNKTQQYPRDKHKKQMSLKRKHVAKNFFQTEIEQMDIAGLGKVTIETDSSEDDCFVSQAIPKDRAELTPDCCRIPIFINLFENCTKPEHIRQSHINECTGKKHTDNELIVSHITSLTSSTTGDTNPNHSGGSETSSSQKSQVVPDSNPKFEINDFRTKQDGLEELELSGGFFKDGSTDMFNGKTDEDIDKDNLSEFDEDDMCVTHEDELISKPSSAECEESSDLRCTNPTLESETDPLGLLEVVAEKVQQIQKNALDILMQTSKALHNRGTTSKDRIKIFPKSNPSTSDILVSKRSVVLPTVIPTIPKATPKTCRERTEECEAVSKRNSYNQRSCPFYKKIPGTSLTVDAFKYGDIPDCRAYILSHFHYDHYGGLKKSFSHPLYCSKITGNLVTKKVGVKPQFVHTVPLNTPTVVDGVEITFLEANHCPGAVLILFKLKTGRVFLHTGDFRACGDMESYPELQTTRIHSLYLDTTYCDPQYDFPSQKEAVSCAIKLAREAVRNNPTTLIVCGSYTIGKERIFKGIAEELDCKVCVTREKKSVIDCLEDVWLQKRTSLSWNESQLHVIPMAKLNYMGLKDHLEKNGKKFTSVLAIKPTGWTYNKKLVSMDHIKPEVNRDNIKLYGLPYSEHSSFLELKRFVQFTKPDKILPTVNNGNYHSRKKMEVIFESWMKESQAGPIKSYIQPLVSQWTS